VSIRQVRQHGPGILHLNPQQQLDDIVDKDDCHDLHPRLRIRSRVGYARCFIESAFFAEEVRHEIHPTFRLDSSELPK
jgi:hypothetical protein